MTVVAQLAAMSFSPIPVGSLDRSTWEVRVEYRSGLDGAQRFAVVNGGYCLGTDGEWEHEPQPSSRTEEWLDGHRFDYDTATRLALQHCGQVTWNGRTADQIAEKYR